ncbi:DUF4328 domain-containing protein [Gordonia sp. NB41Y]|uniref:DUF4328 domain-containing protein n=1 Tax=Gordonia sp. NB41Y TaxID=875808 RepID=UPI00273CE2A3|nr:DUF4328 domain-containing protein [Gordonia sp. NB41Y]WLP92771.1 DUF4328 domain-containing protein [Gordonia sp. NB41Y]
MLDLCPRCRIQAPHRPGRGRCPRCGGPLTVVASDAEASAVVARYAALGSPAPGHPQTQAYPQAPAHPQTPPSQTPMAGPPARPSSTVSRPAGIHPAGAPRMYRSRHVRWVARRPADTLPRPRPARVRIPRRIPRYIYLPTWGLYDAPIDETESTRDSTRLGAALTTAFNIAGAIFVASALAHLLRYLLLVINRSTTLPGWLIAISTALVLVAGLFAIGGLVYATVVFVRWLIAVRADTYADAGHLEPRRRWQMIVLSAIPLVNLVGAPLLLHEAVAMADGGPTGPNGVDGRSRDRLVRLWVGWAVVNAVAVAAAVTWWVAAASGSIQTGANALLLVIVTAAVSAAFAYWAARRLPALFTAEAHQPAPARRWVVAA